jgi:hypothetical protein
MPGQHIVAFSTGGPCDPPARVGPVAREPLTKYHIDYYYFGQETEGVDRSGQSFDFR